MLTPTNGRSYDFLYSFVGDLPSHIAWRNTNKGRLLFRRPTKAKKPKKEMNEWRKNI
jgi:hypothetical protein